MAGQYVWTVEMREISGLGGQYEAACRAMVAAGCEWFDAHPAPAPKFHTYTNLYLPPSMIVREPCTRPPLGTCC